MIIASLQGGLGNQMFQYALARNLAQKRREDFFLVFSSGSADQPRTYGLKNLMIIEKLAPECIARWHKRRANRVWRLIFKILKPRPPFTIVREKSFGFDPEILKMAGGLYLDGYWQSEKYFVEIRNLIRDEFQPKKIGAAASRLKTEIETAKNPVSVHVRRADYVTNKKTLAYHGICEPEYYQAAAGLIRSRAPEPRFFVFSDDIAWTKENIILGGTTTYVEGCADYEDMHLMSLCHHNIIANSSFSWWGAWLNPHPDKIVIAPKKWFNNPSIDTRDLIPEGWVMI